MNSNSKQKCPNNECNGDITVKYYLNIYYFIREK